MAAARPLGVPAKGTGARPAVPAGAVSAWTRTAGPLRYELERFSGEGAAGACMKKLRWFEVQYGLGFASRVPRFRGDRVDGGWLLSTDSADVQARHNVSAR